MNINNTRHFINQLILKINILNDIKIELITKISYYDIEIWNENKDNELYKKRNRNK